MSSKITALTSLSGAPQASDILPIVDDPGGTPLSRKVTLANLLKGGMGHNVHHYSGSVTIGDSNYSTGAGGDATAAFQAAHDAAIAAGGSGIVIIPGNQTYRITSTIYTQQGVIWKGLGGRDSVGFGNPPFLIWDGAANGCMFEAVGSGGYILGCQFHDLCIRSGASITNKLSCAVRFPSTARADSGTLFRNLWIQAIDGTAGNGIEVLGGSTNFYLEGGRFDGIPNGYAIYVDNNSHGFVGVISGNTNYVGGGTTQGKGFIFIDAETSYGESHLQISGLHTEINQDLIETFASGTNPSDKQGIIRLGCTTDAGLCHSVSVNGWYNAMSGGLKSYSAFLITATSGTDAAVASRVKLSVNNGNTLHFFASGDSATTGEVRLVGGKVPAHWRYKHKSARQSSVTWSFGPDSNGDAVGGGIFQRPGTFMVMGMGFVPLTYAQIDASYSEGAIAYITDATAVTLGSVVAGGSTHKVLAMNDGTNWRIIAKVEA